VAGDEVRDATAGKLLDDGDEAVFHGELEGAAVIGHDGGALEFG
jgi:hypothetical protein